MKAIPLRCIRDVLLFWGSRVGPRPKRVAYSRRSSRKTLDSDGPGRTRSKAVKATHITTMKKKTLSIVGFLGNCSLLCSVLLLLSNLQFSPTRAHVWLSSLALALVGAAYALLQIRLRPGRRVLLKRLLLASTFLLWAIDQLLPAGQLATVLGDVVVSAYVLDLFWIIQEQEESNPGETPIAN